MKKVVSVVLAASLLAGALSMFAGCGQEYAAEIDWDVDLSKPIQLKGLFPNSGMQNFGNSDKDDTAKIIEEATGYKLVYEELASTGAESAVETYLSDRQKFNFMKLDEGCYTTYLDGTLLDLTDLLEKTPEGQVLYQLIDLMDYGWDAVKYTDEEGKQHIYAIPDFGYVNMIDQALVWNVNHLEQIGFETEYGHALPETLSEVTWALEKLQTKFNPTGNGNYHALGVPGASSAEVNQLAACFEVPYKFYLDENEKIQQKTYSKNMEDYIQYMNYLYRKGIISNGWNSSSTTQESMAFSQELHSCIYINYWSIRTLINGIVAQKQIAEKMGITNDYQTVHDEAIAWTLRIRGDGYTFKNVKNEDVSCKNQEKAMMPGDAGGISYYTVIPAYMAQNARHVINYLAKKMEAFAKFYGGEEGVHYNRLTDAEIQRRGLPKAEDYTVENDALYTQGESFNEKIAFVRPYSYEYTDARSGEEKTVTVSEEGKWVQLTPRYQEYIAENSQYCTGTNSVAAKVYCHLHELAFDAWYYCDNFADEESYIHDPMYMAPMMSLWAPVNIVSRSFLLTGVEKSISNSDPVKRLNWYRDNAKEKTATKQGKTYYYWSDAISQEMTDWYNANRKPQLQ